MTYGDASDEDVADVPLKDFLDDLVQQLLHLPSDGFISLQSIAVDLRGLWPELGSSEIVIRGTRRRYYLRKHSWLIDREIEILKTICLPHRVVRDKLRVDRCVFYRATIDGLTLAVVIELKLGKGIANAVITAFPISEVERLRRSELEAEIWRRE